jgi:hypothetical protein
MIGKCVAETNVQFRICATYGIKGDYLRLAPHDVNNWTKFWLSLQRHLEYGAAG